MVNEESFVTEVCPHCDMEATVAWLPIEEGYEMHCPYCGEKIMLCSECPELADDRCDWCPEKGCSMKSTSNLDSKDKKSKRYPWGEKRGEKTMGTKTRTDLVVKSDVLVFLEREELEFLKNGTVEAVTAARESGVDAEWLIKLAAKLIRYCEKDDEVNEAISKTV